jgi:hypothetical protein
MRVVISFRRVSLRSPFLVLPDVPRTQAPAARDREFYGSERFVCEKTRPLFRRLAEK